MLLGHDPNTSWAYADARGLLWELGRKGFELGGTGTFLERLLGCWAYLPLKVPPTFMLTEAEKKGVPGRKLQEAGLVLGWRSSVRGAVRAACLPGLGAVPGSALLAVKRRRTC